MKNLIKKIPVLRSLAELVYFAFIEPRKSFPGSEEYWKKRYQSGETSGAGSYHQFAEFKAEVLNGFVQNRQIKTIIEYGCGDGNQLRLADYPSYIGFDVSPEALSQCRNAFPGDATRTFKLMDAYAGEKAELTLSLDVIYHVIEDDRFFSYMNRLFDSSTRYVIIYSSDTDQQARVQAAHVRHRNFSKWIKQNKAKWRLIQHIPNRYARTKDARKGSFADFYIYERT
ncbi:MAG: class I SAM-dependent methyltransferase [Deltaproteobacteria bacterium]